MKQKLFFAIILIPAILVFLLLAGLVLGQARLVVKTGAVSRVDEKLTQMTRAGSFTGSVLLAQDGRIFLNKGYGLADRAQGIPNTPKTRFHLGSTTKPFTAIGILLLESQGKLSVQDPICKFIAGCPAEWQGITIHHLLTHTSGLSDIQSLWLDTAIQTATSGPVGPAEQAKYLGLTIRWFLDARPGENYAYSNLGYYLLAHIIEQVSGQSYADFLDQAIFTPLNMHSTGYEDSSCVMAKRYDDQDETTEWQVWTPPVSEGAGGLYSTSEDLFLWDQALYTDQLLPQTTLKRMFERYIPNTDDYPLFGYGYGALVTRILGRPLVGGAGGGPDSAFTTFHLRLPADGLTLIVLTNQGGLDTFSLLGDIAGALFLSDLVFALSAIAFMVLLAVLFVAQKNGVTKAVRGIGIGWLLLAIPLAFVFVRYLAEGRGLAILVPLALVLLYMLVEFLLDFIFRVEFRRSWKTHVPYIVLETIALFSLIGIAFNIHRTYGYVVSIAFWILLAGLITLFWDKIWVRKRKEP